MLRLDFGELEAELLDGGAILRCVIAKQNDFGLAEIEFMGEVTSGRIIFGPDDCEPLLGVTALESVGIIVEPATQKLKRMPAIPLK